jgi:outer membrane protein assembly factor BamB
MIGGSRAVVAAAILASAFLAGGSAAVPAGNGDAGVPAEVTYAWRWGVTERPQRPIAPPFRAVWTSTPIVFERWNPGGASEAPSRRVSLHENGLLTVMRRTLYVLDRRDGAVIWSTRLRGKEIFDWKLMGDIVVYASYEGDERSDAWFSLRGAIDVKRRKEAWHRKVPIKYYRSEWLLLAPPATVIVGGDRGTDLEALDSVDGSTRWRVPKDVRPVDVRFYSWFVVQQTAYALVTGPTGLSLKGYDVATGQDRGMRLLIRGDKVSNLPAPLGVAANQFLICADERIRSNADVIVGYDLLAKSVEWATQVDHRGRSLVFGKKLAVGTSPDQPVVASYWPNRYVVLGTRKGDLVRDGQLPGYEGWTDQNAMLYSHPYVFAGARRSIGRKMAYDLIALNVESGAIEWAYELDRQGEPFLTADAEILNFVVEGSMVYVARADGRVMAFRSAVTSK